MTYEEYERVSLAFAHEYAQARGRTLSICEAMIYCIAGAVDTSFAVHTSTLKGSTISLIHGNMADRKLYTVSIYPGRTVELWTTPNWEQLFEFALANLELLLKPAHAIGTWRDDWSQMHVLDVVVCLADRDAALDLGIFYHQLTIYDLALRREIKIVRSSEALLLDSAGVGNV